VAVRRHPALLLVAARWLAALLAAAVLAAGAARAEYGRVPDSHIDPAALEIDQSRFLGTPLAPDLALVAEDGRPFELGELLGKPVLLLFSYYSCDGACPTVNRRLAEAIAGAKRFRAAEDYQVLTLSFDRKDTPAGARRFVQVLGADAAATRAWRFALFADGSDIKRVAESVGYRFFWSVRDRVFVHPNVLIVLSPEGRVARYLPSWTIAPRDIELALIEADWNRITASTRLLDIAAGICFSYNFKEGRYVLNAPLFIAAGSLTLGFASVIAGFAVFRRSRRKERQDA
jgi:protein SCO1/2